MNPWIITAIILVIGAVVIFFLYRKGNQMQNEQAEQKEKLVSSAQKVTMLIIDKKRLPLKESGLPQMVIDQAPKRARRAKVPVVKAKVGPKIMSLIADEDIYDQIPVNASVHAMVSGIYITSINNYRKAPVETPEKKSFAQRILNRANGSK